VDAPEHGALRIILEAAPHLAGNEPIEKLGAAIPSKSVEE